MRKVRGKLFLGVACIFASLLVGWQSFADTNDLPNPIASASPEATPTDSPSPEITSPSPTPSPSDSVVASESPVAIPTPEPSSTEEPAASPKTSSAPTPPPIVPLADQSMYIVLPRIIPVDPRAHSALMPTIFFIGPGSLMLCIDSNQDALYLEDNKYVSIKGNGSEHLIINGDYSSISSLFNDPGGKRIYSRAGGIGNSVMLFRFVALSGASMNPSFCSNAAPSNTRTLTFDPIKLALNITKATVSVKK